MVEKDNSKNSKILDEKDEEQSKDNEIFLKSMLKRMNDNQYT